MKKLKILAALVLAVVGCWLGFATWFKDKSEPCFLCGRQAPVYELYCVEVVPTSDLERLGYVMRYTGRQFKKFPLCELHDHGVMDSMYPMWFPKPGYNPQRPHESTLYFVYPAKLKWDDWNWKVDVSNGEVRPNGTSGGYMKQKVSL